MIIQSISTIYIVSYHIIDVHVHRSMQPIKPMRKYSYNIYTYIYQYVPHKALAEVSKIANFRRLVVVKHGSPSKSTDGSAQCSCSCNCSCDVVVVGVVVVVQ